MDGWIILTSASMNSISSLPFFEVAPQTMTLDTFWNGFPQLNRINPVVLLVVSLFSAHIVSFRKR
jgi:hypothetical protein